MEVGGTWYLFESTNGGKTITHAHRDVETGTLKLDVKSLSADWLVMKGTDKFENCYYNLVPGGKQGVVVPAGTYELFSGQVSKGKRQQTMKALILPGDNTRTWSVGAGETMTVELGAPFGFDFDFSQDEETLTIQGGSVVVTGKSKETYQRLWNCVVHPEVMIRKAGTRRGNKEKKLRSAQSQEGHHRDDGEQGPLQPDGSSQTERYQQADDQRRGAEEEHDDAARYHHLCGQ